MRRIAPLALLRSAPITLFILTALTSTAAKQTQQYIVCKDINTDVCLTWLVDYADALQIVRKVYPNIDYTHHCGFSDIRIISPHQKFITVEPLDKDPANIIFCKIAKLIIKDFGDWTSPRTMNNLYRTRRQTPYSLRGRYRGQTQSQYLTIDHGNGKDEGKAEAHSAADSSRASVSGSSGMGQAQSQTMYDPSCDDCVGRSESDAESLKRRPFDSHGSGSSGGAPLGGSSNGPYGIGGERPGANGNYGPPQDGTQGGKTLYGPNGSGHAGYSPNQHGGGGGAGIEPSIGGGGGSITPGVYGITQNLPSKSGGYGPTHGVMNGGGPGSFVSNQNGGYGTSQPGVDTFGGHQQGLPPGTAVAGGLPSGNVGYSPHQFGTGGYPSTQSNLPHGTGNGNLQGGTPGGNNYGQGQGGGYSPPNQLLMPGVGVGSGSYEPGQQRLPGGSQVFVPNQNGLQSGADGNGAYGPNQNGLQGGSGGGPFGPNQMSGAGDGRLYSPSQNGLTPGAAFIPGSQGTLQYKPNQPGQTATSGPYNGANWPSTRMFTSPDGTTYYCCVVGPNNNPQYFKLDSNALPTTATSSGVPYGSTVPNTGQSTGTYSSKTPSGIYGSGMPSGHGTGPFVSGNSGSNGPYGTYGTGPNQGNIYTGPYNTGITGGHNGLPQTGQYGSGTGGTQPSTGPTGGTNLYGLGPTGGQNGMTIPGGHGVAQGPSSFQGQDGSQGPGGLQGHGNVPGTGGPQGQAGVYGQGGLPGPLQGQGGIQGPGSVQGQGIGQVPSGLQRPGGMHVQGGYQGPGEIPGSGTIQGQGGLQAPGALMSPGSQLGPGNIQMPGVLQGPGGLHGPGNLQGAGGIQGPGGLQGTAGMQGPGLQSTGGIHGPGSLQGTGEIQGPGGHYGSLSPGGQNGIQGPGGQTTLQGSNGQYAPGIMTGSPDLQSPAGGANVAQTGLQGHPGSYAPGPLTSQIGPQGTNTLYPSGSSGGQTGLPTQYIPGTIGQNGYGTPTGTYGTYGPGAAGGQNEQHPYGGGATGGPSTGPGGTSPYGHGPQGEFTGSQTGIPNQYGTGQGAYGSQYGNGVTGTGQYGNGPYGYVINGNSDQNINHAGIPQNVMDPNAIGGAVDGDDSEAEASVSQAANGTIATASSKGGNDKGRAQTHVHGAYTGGGSFSAQAEISGENKAANSEVTGDKKGASSNAQGSGKNNKSQANVQLGSETGSVLTGSQSQGTMHSSNTQVQGSVKGGMADAQARGPGSTSSQAQIGFTPYKEGDKSHDLQKVPFVGGGTASAQSSGRTGSSQSQLRGTFKYGITYNGGAQAGASLNKDTVFPNRLPFEKIDVYDESNKNVNVNNESTEKSPESITENYPQTESPSVTENTISLNPAYVITSTEPPFNDRITTEKTDEVSRDSETQYGVHTHSDHHKANILPTVPVPTLAPPVESRRSFQPTYSTNNGDYEYTTDKEDNPPEDYDVDDGFGPEGPETTDVEQGEYSTYNEFSRDSEQTHQSLHSPRRKGLEVRQTTGGNTQHIVLGSLKNHDAEITQRNSERPDESKVYQPGERVPGTGGYTIPVGFTGSVKSVASKDKTYVVGSKDSPSQAQTVSLSPGHGKVKYTYPASYARNVNPKNLRSLYQPKQDDNNRYVSVSKSVTRDLDAEDNIRKQYSHTYYTKSSSCGYFTFTCTMVSGAEGRKKVCKPKIPTNPDGTPMRC